MEIKKDDLTKKVKPINDVIKNRNSWIKTIVILFFTFLIGYKLIYAEINFDFSEFDFTDLLALILALFSIGLAVMFYFKATDTSNLFYDNTYKFTKDISEILGRIEAGFGERLKHLDEGYTGLRDKFDETKFTHKTTDIESFKKELDEEKEKLETQVKEKEEILQELMNKAKLNAREKEIFTNKIKHKDDEINSLNSELRSIKRNLSHYEMTRDNELIGSIPPSIRDVLMEYLKREGNYQIILEAPHDYLVSHIRPPIDFLPKSELHRLLKFGVINDEYSFTTMGVELLKSIAKRII